jgi:FkbM family methyltransferase
LKKYIVKYGWLGFKLYLYKKIKFPHSVKICLPQFKDVIVLRPNTSDINVFEQIFIDEEYRCVIDAEPNIIVDAGANIGLASIYYAMAYPKARIVAIEPESSNFELLKENVKNYSNIYCENAGLWDKSTYLKIYNPYGQKHSFTVEESNDPQGIKAITVDDVMNQHDFPFIDILKVDIEGAEKEVFSGHPGWIKKVGMIVIELHDKERVGCNRAFYTATDAFLKEEYRRGENVFLVTCSHKKD